MNLETRSKPKKFYSGRPCLLKGCKKHFIPSPDELLFAMFCSLLCRRAASKWKRWLQKMLWRISPAGKEAKRCQNQRFRKKYPEYFVLYRKRNGDQVRAIEIESKRRCRGGNSRKSGVHKVGQICRIPCRRPGCFNLFLTIAALAKVRLYCRKVCRVVMRRYSNLITQLRYRKTLGGNFKRKLSRSYTPFPS